MSYGLRVWDVNGNLTLDITNRLTRIWSTHSFSVAANSSQNIAIPGISTDGTWGVYSPFIPSRIFSGYVTIYNRASVTQNGTLLVVRL